MMPHLKNLTVRWKDYSRGTDGDNAWSCWELKFQFDDSDMQYESEVMVQGPCVLVVNEVEA